MAARLVFVFPRRLLLYSRTFYSMQDFAGLMFASKEENSLFVRWLLLRTS
jgi:hypothetical protein